MVNLINDLYTQLMSSRKIRQAEVRELYCEATYFIKDMVTIRQHYSPIRYPHQEKPKPSIASPKQPNSSTDLPIHRPQSPQQVSINILARKITTCQPKRKTRVRQSEVRDLCREANDFLHGNKTR
jgi:hypothetical protein